MLASSIVSNDKRSLLLNVLVAISPIGRPISKLGPIGD